MRRNASINLVKHCQGRGRGEQGRGQYPGGLQDASIKHVKYCQGRGRGEQGRGQYPGGLQDASIKHVKYCPGTGERWARTRTISWLRTGRASSLSSPWTATGSHKLKVQCNVTYSLRYQCCGSVTFWNGAGSVPLTNGYGIDSGFFWFRQWPWRWQLKIFFFLSKFFIYYFFEATFTSFSKDKKSKRSHKTAWHCTVHTCKAPTRSIVDRQHVDADPDPDSDPTPSLNMLENRKI